MAAEHLFDATTGRRIEQTEPGGLGAVNRTLA
jgi:hypothetical protein